jgi:hypothetical protein
MSVDDLINDLIRSGIFALIGSRVTKSIGEKDISDIISGTGWAIIAVDIIGIAKPTASAIVRFFNTIGGFADKIEKIFNNGLLEKIINFGAKGQVLQ